MKGTRTRNKKQEPKQFFFTTQNLKDTRNKNNNKNTNYLRNNVQRQRHTDKLLGSSTNGPDPVFHSCLGTKGPNPN